MKLIDIKAIQILLLKFNEIPFQILTNRSNLDLLSQKFRFNTTDFIHDQATNELVMIRLANGLFNTEKKEEIGIESLAIENRKIVTHINNSSEYFSNFYSKLRNFIQNLISKENNTELLQPILTTYESEVVAQLDISFKNILSNKLISLIEKDIKSDTESELADSSIDFHSINFKVSFFPLTKILNDYRITLTRKDLTFAAARGYPPEDNVYFFKAPFETNTHIKLIEKIEAELS